MAPLQGRLFVIAALTAWAELLGERIERAGGFRVVGIASDGEAGVRQLQRMAAPPDIVVVDVGAPVALQSARMVHVGDARVRIVAVGLDDNPAQVLSWAVAGATGLVARTASLDELVETLAGVARGEAPCSPSVTSALLRAVGGSDSNVRRAGSAAVLTEREAEVARLVADGLSNKEIARHLQIEPGTVKSHVHSLMRKLGVSRRAHVGANMRVEGLVAASPVAADGHAGLSPR